MPGGSCGVAPESLRNMCTDLDKRALTPKTAAATTTKSTARGRLCPRGHTWRTQHHGEMHFSRGMRTIFLHSSDSGTLLCCLVLLYTHMYTHTCAQLAFKTLDPSPLPSFLFLPESSSDLHLLICVLSVCAREAVVVRSFVATPVSSSSFSVQQRMEEEGYRV